MHDKRDDKRGFCYHGGPKSSVVIAQYLSKSSDIIFLPLCYVKYHQGVVRDTDRVICEKRGCRHYSRALPDAITEELERCARKSVVKRHGKPETIQSQDCLDSISLFFPYCANPNRQGIIYGDKYQKCERKNCKFLTKFRTPAGHRRKRRKPIVLKCLQDLQLHMLR